LKIFNQLVKIRKISANIASLKISNVTASLDYSGFNHCDLAVEAVVENMQIKQNILQEIESQLPNHSIIASNTSSLSISQMASVLKNPERFIGMHFFNPVNKMPLIEVIKGEKTSDEAVLKIVKLAKDLQKTPIVVKDVPGFLVNRILLTYLNEAGYLLQDGFSIKEIDNEIENFGMPMGPFVLADVVGIDVGVKVAKSLEEGYGSRMKVAEILNEIYYNHKELLGKKSQIGFYQYENDKIAGENNKIYTILDQLEAQNLISLKSQKTDISEVIDRCILTMINESAKCLEEKVVANAKYLDMAMIMGAGFPAFRGGVLRYCDKIGVEVVVKKLQNLEKRLGNRFTVSNLLLEMAKNN
ncbi:MAG: 3-hydroxyacyl-CoA dehydrogenase NAD-binding domain-containing protein, partial [Alphaproteobacteria bacterium]